MDPSQATGGIFLSGALIIGGLGMLVGCITYLFHRLFAAMAAQIAELRGRVDRGEERYDRLNERHITALEGTIAASTKTQLTAEDSADERFQHLMAQMQTVLDRLPLKDPR